MYKVGNDATYGYEVCISDKAVNKDCIVTGMKGGGKTRALNSMERNLAKSGANVLVLNVDGTHDEVLSDTKNYHSVTVKDRGIPIPLLECFGDINNGSETVADVCEEVAEVFMQIERLGYIHQSMLTEACEMAVTMRNQYDDDMQCLYDAILSLECNSKNALLAKYRNIFRRVKFHQKLDLWRAGKATVLDFSGYSHSMQLLLAQMVMSALWRYHRVFGQRMNAETWIVLDEFQYLPLKTDSLLTQILREGRKYKLSLLLATQTISNFDSQKLAVLQQPGTKLYFRPDDHDLKRIAKSFPDIEAKDAKRILQNLRIGECLANGEFEIAGESKQRSLKLSFWEEVSRMDH